MKTVKINKSNLSHLEVVAGPKRPSAQLFEGAIGDSAAGFRKRYIATFYSEKKFIF